jgi:hypothetical protein
VSDIERAVERVYDVLPPLAATIVGDVINGATVTGRVLPQHVQQTLAAEVLGMAAEVSAEELARELVATLELLSNEDDVAESLLARYRITRREASSDE